MTGRFSLLAPAMALSRLRPPTARALPLGAARTDRHGVCAMLPGLKCCTAPICTPACRAEETLQGPHATLHFNTLRTTFPHVSCCARGSSSTVSHAGGRAGRACVCDHAARDAALARVPVRGIARVQLIAGVDHPQLWLLDHLLHTRQTFQCQINDNVSALSLPVTAGLECWRSGGHTDRPGPATPG